MKPTDEHLTDEDIFGVPGYDEDPEGREEMAYDKIILDKIEVAELHKKQLSLDTVRDLTDESYWQGYLDACTELLLEWTKEREA